MRTTLRGKLLFIAVATALAFLLVIAISALIGLREARHLEDVEGRLLPRIEAGPQIEADYERLKRALHDAAAAQEPDALADTRGMMGTLTRRVAGARDVLDAGRADVLLSALESYYQAAFDVARRMIARETGEAMVDAVSAMQARQTRAEEALQAAIRLDRGQLGQSFAAIKDARRTANQLRLGIGGLAFLTVLVLLLGVSRSILRVVGTMSTGFARFGRGDFSQPIELGEEGGGSGNSSDKQLGSLAHEANQMAKSLLRLGQERDHTDWLKAGQSGLAHTVRGELSAGEVAMRAIGFLASYLGAPAGALYLSETTGKNGRATATTPEATTLRLVGHAGLGDDVTRTFALGEGLVGQTARGHDIVEIETPPNYLRLRSGLGEGSPSWLALVPLVHLGRVRGVLELALTKPLGSGARELVTSIGETLIIALEVAQSRQAMAALLAETQHQAARLAAQEQELRAGNEELVAQQEELRQANEELETQRVTLEEQNQRLEEAQKRLEQKAAELVTVSGYKSRFLASMSHELRTPLNSMLILSELLSNNEAGNLTSKQVEFCKTINSAGRDLLALINQVLDLSKIEAGKQHVRPEAVTLSEITRHIGRIFEPLAHDKGLAFAIDVETGVPASIITDRQRLEQILTNLIGNGIKFTEQGKVTLRIEPAKPEARLRRRDLLREHAEGRALAFIVADTGVGIAPEHQELVFAPFERLDSKTDARYGSTGLGLSIARELAALLGGELHLESQRGRGSTFTIFLPFVTPAPVIEAASPGAAVAAAAEPAPSPRPVVDIPDDRETLGEGDTAMLLIEDDPVFSERLVDVIRARGFRVLVAGKGEDGLALARRYRPSGIILDVQLPDLSGWTVMDRLRRDPDTEGIPVHFVSAVDSPDRGWAMGAVGYLTKPASNRDLVSMVQSLAPRAAKRLHQILVLEADPSMRGTEGQSIVDLLETNGLRAQRVSSAREAFAALQADRFVCLILDLGVNDLDGLGFLEELKSHDGLTRPPVVVYTGRPLTRDETRRLEAYAEAVVLKEGRSSQRLLEEIRLFIHHLEDRLPRERKPRPPRAPVDDGVFRGKRLLVVDDDMRTVYALSALLRTKGVDVMMADTGRAAVDTLQGEAGEAPVDAIIMDVMMPEMDGYEAMRRIRAIDRFAGTPIIALTAKAMKGEREKCLEAGASDYLSKPIDSNELLTLLAGWLGGRRPSDGVAQGR